MSNEEHRDLGPERKRARHHNTSIIARMPREILDAVLAFVGRKPIVTLSIYGVTTETECEPWEWQNSIQVTILNTSKYNTKAGSYSHDVTQVHHARTSVERLLVNFPISQVHSVVEISAGPHKNQYITERVYLNDTIYQQLDSRLNQLDKIYHSTPSYTKAVQMWPRVRTVREEDIHLD
jgi:hypothetical protein